MKRFIIRNSIEFLWGICIVLVITFLSLKLLSLYNGTSGKMVIIPHIFWILTIILVFSFLWLAFFRRKVILSESEVPKKAIDYGVVLFLLFFVSILFVRNYEIEFLSNNVGGLFIILMGVITVIGFYLAIKSIVDMKQTITSYPQLVNSLIDLIEKPTKEIRIVSYFVLPGYWQVGKILRKQLKDELFKKRDKIKIACINESEHLNFLIDIAIKGTNEFPEVTEKNIEDVSKRIMDFQIMCEKDLLSHFTKNAADRRSWQELPNFYFFVTDERAIIVTPVGLPKLNGSIDKNKVDLIINQMNNNPRNNQNIINSLKELIKDTLNQSNNNISAKVYSLGFETNDPFIINMLWEEFNKYYTIPENDESE